MIPAALLVATTILLAGSTLWQARRPIGTALLAPSVWLVTIPVQSLVLASRLQFSGAPLDNMYIAISFANVTFVGLQVLSSRGVLEKLRGRVSRWLRREDEAPNRTGHAHVWFGALLVVAVGLALLHWALMPGIPLFQIFQGLDGHQLQLARENSAKLLAVPTILKYVFTWNSRILLPVLFTMAVLSRWRWAAIAVGVFGLIYILSPLERLPAVLFTFAPFAAIAIRDGKKIWSPMLIVGAVVAILPAAAVTEAFNYAVAAHPAPTAATPAPSPTPTDNSPLSPPNYGSLPAPIAAAVDLVLRRMGEGPTDDTYQWFAYFPAQHAFLGGSGWEPWRVLQAGYQSPANLVGVWAYYGRYGYTVSSISSYAAFIADGWAEFGIAGVVISCILLLVLFVGLDLLRGLADRPFLLACYAVSIIFVAVVNPIGGLPAIVLSSGVWLVPLLCAGYILTDGRFRTAGRLQLVKRPTAL